ncbi:MAG: hypothetical protein QM796_22835 [Chthoniobacteraceae bacterium]
MRLTKTEIATFAATGVMEERVNFGSDAALVYRLESRGELTTVTAIFQGAQISVQVPATEAAEWATGEKVGLYGEAGWGLKIAIEKDFKCLDPRRDEDESDAFENPHGPGHTACESAAD